MCSQLRFCLFLLAINLSPFCASSKGQSEKPGQTTTNLTTAEMAKRVTDLNQLREAGWVMPMAPYPAKARAAHEQGEVFLKISTGSDGKVTQVSTPSDSQHSVLEGNSAVFIKANWHGPATRTIYVKLIYQLR